MPTPRVRTDPHGKPCSGCKTWKPNSAYQKRASAYDGLQVMCRDCYAIAWQARDPEAKRRKKQRYYAENTERYKDAVKAYRERIGKATTAEWARQWRVANLERARAIQRRASAKRRHRGDGHHAEYAAILNADPCSYCGRVGGQVDHVVPLSEGGDGCWDNLTSTCRSCNASKKSKPLLVFLLDSEVRCANRHRAAIEEEAKQNGANGKARVG